ncbi:hypothetical protein AAFO90_11730 [Phaeobacter sp. CAU 1743]|uniref:hypothetical protein n=1 Tax=Phaeobacter sp. CAU 1743 TaxID=3140367 RepID=UPI00325AAB52
MAETIAEMRLPTQELRDDIPFYTRVCGHSGFPSWLKSDSSFQNGGLNERRAVCVDR